ncbi:hypothetical protein [Clostridium sp. DJ247]|uniref:hypothetical protein n=1 Tax=Clostridium sp. DJ247 TaxID=2726188 RepID=UPI0016235534|nr:hypothetical protein [Clostridium sp. DJ247]MBC2579396.1 hypothetical protein [Clostridium sp. DJ247]
MQEDFGYIIIDNQEAFKILKSYQGKWIYVKSTVNYFGVDKVQHNRFGMYSKLKVQIFQNLSDVIYLYGDEDRDRVLIGKNDILQCEKSYGQDGVNLKILIGNDNSMIWLYFLEDFISDTVRSRSDSVKTIMEQTSTNLVITEGKTDWKHLKRALNKLNNKNMFCEDDFKFLEYNDTEMGNTELMSLCKQLSKIPNKYKIICIFDADVPNILNKVTTEGATYKEWGNNVFSFVIPVPKHRENTPQISIEHYYTDEELQTEDINSRRLYMGKEFSNISGIHYNKDRFCVNKNRCGEKSISILDSEIYLLSDENKNIALSKNDFADNISKEISPFDNISYENFKSIFEIIKEIISKKNSVGESNKTYGEQIIDWGKDLKNKGCKIIYQEGNILSIVVKDDKYKVTKLKNNPTVTIVSYIPEYNIVLICVYPSNGDENDGVVIPIQLGNKLEEDILKKISLGSGQIELFSISDDLEEISAKVILRDEMGRMALKMELEKAGLI